MLAIKDIYTAYGPIMALRGVSLEVPEGAVVALLGGNGAGKSTTLRTISGLVHPVKGQIQFLGRSIEKASPEKIVQMGISQVQEGRQIFPELTVMENLRLGAYVRREGRAVRQDIERVYNYFPVLKERQSQQAGTLSGGEQQMVAIGRALMARPRILLLDEPSLGLAPLVVQQIFGIIRALNESEGITILLVEQNAKLALGIARYGYVLEIGRVVLEDSGENLRKDEAVRRSYLGY
jgi:branched-chain amino acid transport system ATP-binding protein